MALSRVIATGDGSTTQFAISFALGYINEADIQCRVANEVDGFGDPVYRDLTFINPGLVEVGGTVPADGDRVEFTRTMDPEELLVDFTDGDILNDTNLNLAQKQSMMLIHQLLDGRFNAFDSDIDMGGFKITNLGDPTEDGDAVTLGYILENALDAGAAAAAAAASAAAALVSASNASDSAAAAAASEAGVSADAAAAAVSEANALTYANNSFTSAMLAGNSEDAAAASAAAALVSENNAEAAEVNAETAETNAETAQAAAETAADDAETARLAAVAAQVAAEAALASTLTAYDNFDDRYLGSKTSDPTLDNDGNALVAGSLYFNSVDGIMKVYTGSIWVAAYVSGGDFLPLAGGTMTGTLVLNGDPGSALHAATKQYVDTRALKAGDTFTGPVIFDAADGTDPSLRIPHGTAPASPTNGDVWTTSADLLVRITGVTYKMVNIEGAQTISGVKTFSSKLTTTLSGTGGAMFILPHGVAPSSPVDGDVWTTSAGGLFARINGTTLNFQSKFTTLSGYGITDAAAKAQNNEVIAGVIAGSLSDKSYTLVLKIPHGGTITNATTKCLSGTCTMTFKINTTALGGTANAVSSAEQTQAHSTNNVFNADDDIVVTISSNSSCVDASFSLEYSRSMD